MPFSSRSYVNRYIPSNRFPPGLRWLLIANIAISVLNFILRASNIDVFVRDFALVPAQVVQSFAIWQLATYMFVHVSISQVLWNMLALWLFGIELERGGVLLDGFIIHAAGFGELAGGEAGVGGNGGIFDVLKGDV